MRNALEQHDRSRHLEPAARTARARADEHQQHEYRFRERRPKIEIRRSKARRRDHRRDGERRMFYRLARRILVRRAIR